MGSYDGLVKAVVKRKPDGQTTRPVKTMVDR